MRRLTYVLLVLLVASVPLESIYTVPGAGSLTKLVGVLTGLTWAAGALRRGSMRSPQPLHVLALLFVLWNACSLLWTTDASATETRASTYAQLWVLLLVVWDTVTTEREVRTVLLADLVGCAVAATLLLAGYALHGSGAEVHGRVTVGGFNPNDAGVILALGLPVACYLWATWVGPGRRAVVLLAATYLPLGGQVFLSLTTRGDASAGSGLALDRMPVADASGDLDYDRTFPADQLPDGLLEQISHVHVVQHGIDVNDNGTYDLDGAGVSTFAENLGLPDVPEEATDPAACGVVTGAMAPTVPVGGVETGGGTPGGPAVDVPVVGAGVALLLASGLFWLRGRRRDARG